jgi:two-component system OmpR family response regulator
MKDKKTSQDEETASPQAQGRIKPPRRILVVDDDVYVRQMSADVLTLSGYQVDVAEDGEAGWEALNTSPYDLLITDNNMPKVSGLELVQKVRSARMALPVILASGALPSTDLNLQLDAMLSKPFNNHELLGTVKKVLCLGGEQIDPPPSRPGQTPAGGLRL